MDKDELIERLLTELNMTQIAMGQVICNNLRAQSKAGMVGITESWISRAGYMDRDEWIPATFAFRQFLKTHQTPSASKALEMLAEPIEVIYERRTRHTRGIYRIKGKKPQAQYELGLDNLRNEYIPRQPETDITLTSNQNAQYDKGGLRMFGRIRAACKSNIARVTKWL